MKNKISATFKTFFANAKNAVNRFVGSLFNGVDTSNALSYVCA